MVIIDYIVITGSINPVPDPGGGTGTTIINGVPTVVGGGGGGTLPTAVFPSGGDGGDRGNNGAAGLAIGLTLGILALIVSL